MRANRLIGAAARVFTIAILTLIAPSVCHGAPISLYTAFGPPPVGAQPGNFAHDVVTLNEAFWHVGSLGGPAPTQSQFLSLLDNLTSLALGVDDGGTIEFDNVNFANLAISSFDPTPGCTNDGWIHAGCDLSYGVGTPLGDANFNAALGTLAPAKFLGTKLSAYNGILSLDIEQPPQTKLATVASVVLTTDGSRACDIVVDSSGLPQTVCGPATVPEPSSLLFFLVGAGIVAMRRQRPDVGGPAKTRA